MEGQTKVITFSGFPNRGTDWDTVDRSETDHDQPDVKKIMFDANETPEALDCRNRYHEKRLSKEDEPAICIVFVWGLVSCGRH